MHAPLGLRVVMRVQHQNSNLAWEFAPLADDIGEPEWASQAFGQNPDGEAVDVHAFMHSWLHTISHQRWGCPVACAYVVMYDVMNHTRVRYVWAYDSYQPVDGR